MISVRLREERSWRTWAAECQVVPEVSIETREVIAAEAPAEEAVRPTDIEQPENEMPTAAESSPPGL